MTNVWVAFGDHITFGVETQAVPSSSGGDSEAKKRRRATIKTYTGLISEIDVKFSSTQIRSLLSDYKVRLCRGPFKRWSHYDTVNDNDALCSDLIQCVEWKAALTGYS